MHNNEQVSRINQVTKKKLGGSCSEWNSLLGLHVSMFKATNMGSLNASSPRCTTMVNSCNFTMGTEVWNQTSLDGWITIWIGSTKTMMILVFASSLVSPIRKITFIQDSARFRWFSARTTFQEDISQAGIPVRIPRLEKWPIGIKRYKSAIFQQTTFDWG